MNRVTVLPSKHLPAKYGFTLLEVIIALALFSTLMTLLWSLFHTYSRLALRSQDAAREIQVVRAVSRQLRTDLHHFAQLAVPPDVIPSTEATPAETDPNEAATPSAPQDTTATSQDSGVFATANESSRPAALMEHFQVQLPEETYLKGTATRLEVVTRPPYTVNIPSDSQLIGDETRYGTYQVTVYDYRDAKSLETLLREDPILNPERFRQQLAEQPQPANQMGQPAHPLGRPPELHRLNPNENVGLIREVKSWIHVTRDRQREAWMQQAEASTSETSELQPNTADTQPPRNLLEELRQKTRPSNRLSQAPTHRPLWKPPPELNHQRDHLPEITRLQFRYFDGEQWQLQWDGDRQGLPVAVELAFDVDTNAPASRAEEFENAHTRVANGAALNDVLPADEELPPPTFEELQDPLQTLNLQDPTAIVAEYRFVIALPPVGQPAAELDATDSPISEVFE